MLQLQGLQKWFNKHHVLKGIDFKVEFGEVVAVIGASGSGKSTLLRCVDFLETPDAGAITLGERSFDAAKATKDDITYMRRNTAMVFQSFNLFKYKTALENVTEGLITVQKVPKAEAAERARALLVQVGLEDRVDYYPNKLSGGQQQRVAIARSLALKPKLILFDEPTSALDPEMINEVLNVIKEVAKSGEQAVVIVSHEMNFIYDIADRVVFLDEGSILAEGTPREVFLENKNERVRQFIAGVHWGDDFSI